MYRCEICRTVSKPGRIRLKHTIWRREGQIRREMSICEECDFELQVMKISLENVYAKHARRSTVPAVVLVNRTVELGDDVPLLQE